MFTSRSTAVHPQNTLSDYSPPHIDGPQYHSGRLNRLDAKTRRRRIIGFVAVLFVIVIGLVIGVKFGINKSNLTRETELVSHFTSTQTSTLTTPSAITETVQFTTISSIANISVPTKTPAIDSVTDTNGNSSETNVTPLDNQSSTAVNSETMTTARSSMYNNMEISATVNITNEDLVSNNAIIESATNAETIIHSTAVSLLNTTIQTDNSSSNATPSRNSSE
ncbi:unnamed protein product [Adineta ricciae]|uniref:Uncharacterized protein n=1 Tax=Adineta ricciae TaxID=249248 RepID=A0A813NPG4_ADIRI|nr:unnamed protein product [Adineta ricciae]CAF1237245.1 unnamed protein product [Adineta ricciae]